MTSSINTKTAKAGARETLPVDFAEAEWVADAIRRQSRVLADASWALDQALSSRRKSEAGYRNPDPSTGREIEHFGISDGKIREAIQNAKLILRSTGDSRF